MEWQCFHTPSSAGAAFVLCTLEKRINIYLWPQVLDHLQTGEEAFLG